MAKPLTNHARLEGEEFSRLIGNLPINRGRSTPPALKEWSLAALAGRFVELSDCGTTPVLTAAASLILQAQLRGDPVAWIAVGESVFFPPDIAEWGIDLEALPVLWVGNGMAATRGADQLLRSGAFGLVVLDLGSQTYMRIAIQSRLAALAKKHHTAFLCLTRKKKGAPSLGSLISLYGEGTVERTAFNRLHWKLHILKDKQGTPDWTHEEFGHGSDGMC